MAEKNQKILRLLPLGVLIYTALMSIRGLFHISLDTVMQVYLPLGLLGCAVYLINHAQKGSRKEYLGCRLLAVGYLAASVFSRIESFKYLGVTFMRVVNVFILPIAAVVCIFLSSRMPKTEKNVTAMRLKIPTFLLMLPIALAAVIAVCVIGLQSSPIAWVLLALLLYVAGAVWDDARQKKLQHMAAGVSGNNGRQNHGIIMKYQMMQPLVSSAAIAGMFFYGAYAIRDMIGTGGLFWIFAIVAIVFAGTFIYTLAGFVDYLRYGYSKDFAIKFYNACKQQNLLDSEDDVTVQRMVNLAQNHFGKIVIKAKWKWRRWRILWRWRWWNG